MKRVLLFFAFVLLLTGCSVNSKDKHNDLEKIYQIDDSSMVYSKIDNFKIKLNNSDIKIKEALEQKKITIESLIEKMEYQSTANDGGSIIYKYKHLDDNKRLAAFDFYLIKCNTLSGNKNIILDDDPNFSLLCSEMES